MLKQKYALSDLDPELYRTILVRAKRQLRTRMAGLRRALPPDALAERNRRLCGALLSCDWFLEAPSVGLFWPMLAQNEVDLRSVDQQARKLGKRVYYPFMQDQGDAYTTGFRLVDDVGDLRPNRRGFSEPAEALPVAKRGDLELIVVPALAVSASGHRLGYGAGFYDATLPDFRPPARAISVAFDFQLMGELPVSELDVASDAVITDARVIRCT
jgi:5-formyltetrahydrofolate cyclo-ligase